MWTAFSLSLSPLSLSLSLSLSLIFFLPFFYSVSPSDVELETIISGRDLDNTSLGADSWSNSERAEMILGILPGCTTHFCAALRYGYSPLGKVRFRALRCYSRREIYSLATEERLRFEITIGN